MAKKHFGRLLTLAAVVGAAAAGVSYFLQYKSFHKELDEDFHDFEDDFDDFDDTEEKDDKEANRTYVTLNQEHKPEKEETKEPQAEEACAEEEVLTDAPVFQEEATSPDTDESSNDTPKTTVTVEEAAE